MSVAQPVLELWYLLHSKMAFYYKKQILDVKSAITQEPISYRPAVFTIYLRIVRTTTRDFKKSTFLNFIFSLSIGVGEL